MRLKSFGTAALQTSLVEREGAEKYLTLPQGMVGLWLSSILGSVAGRAGHSRKKR